jgi:hypothetical protein
VFPKKIHSSPLFLVVARLSGRRIPSRPLYRLFVSRIVAAELWDVRRVAMSDSEIGTGFEEELAELIVDALVDADLIPASEFAHAVEIATVEIDVRIALGNVVLK